MGNWEYDFGLNDKEFDLGIKTDKPKKKYDPKDPYGMNSLADDMQESVTETISEISKEVKEFKNEIKPFYDYINSYIKRKKAEKHLKNIQIFGQNVRCLKLQALRSKS